MQSNTQEEAFIEGIMLNKGILHKICLIYGASPSDREDLYQEMVYQLWKSYPSYQGKSKFSTWLYRVALNTAITAIRKKHLITVNDKNIPENLAYEASPDLSEEVSLLYKAITRLKKVDKAIILLWLDEKSYDEISEIIGLSTKNIGVRIVRIKERLTKMIKEESR